MSDSLPDPDKEKIALAESGGEHRIEGRNSSGGFKKGVSGNPKGRPKGTGKRQKEQKEKEKKALEDSAKINFDAKEGKTVADAIELNSARLINACFRGAANGNQRLIEIFFTHSLKDKGGGQNPFVGLEELQYVNPEELNELANKIESGDLDV